MKVMFKVIIFFIFTLYLSQTAFALQIISPDEGQVVYQGNRLTVVVKPDPGEEWEEVSLEIFPMNYNSITKEYKEEIEIPKRKIGVINFYVLAYDKSGKEIELKRSLFVKMPPDVVLKSLSLSNEIMALRKVPQGSDLVDAAKIETRQLGVAGVYSDGVSRQLSSSASGTTYTSSDDKVATVSPDGKVTAQGLGEAKITVRNGSYSATVDVIVKPYKK